VYCKAQALCHRLCTAIISCSNIVLNQYALTSSKCDSLLICKLSAQCISYQSFCSSVLACRSTRTESRRSAGRFRRRNLKRQAEAAQGRIDQCMRAAAGGETTTERKSVTGKSLLQGTKHTHHTTASMANCLPMHAVVTSFVPYSTAVLLNCLFERAH
jgi:hypothetical protein